MPKYAGFRNPQTQQERKQHQEEWVDGYYIPIRGKRKSSRLPNSWDDIQKDVDNCWKNFRKTQYKVKSNKPKKDSTKYAASMSKRDHFYLEHRRCNWKERRCSYCAKNKCWEAYDREIERKHKQYQKEWEEWDKLHGYSDNYFSPNWWEINMRREWIEVRQDDYNVEKEICDGKASCDNSSL